MRHSTGSGTRRQQTGVCPAPAAGEGKGNMEGGSRAPTLRRSPPPPPPSYLLTISPVPAPLYLAAGPRVTCEDVPGVTGLRDSVTVTVAAQYNCAVRHHSSHGGRVSAGTSSVARVAVYAAQQCPGYWPHLHTPPP